jgi:hypothetical protein
MQINELREIDQLLAYVDQKYWDIFCDTWYHGLDAYKEYPHSLLIMANAILNHWDIPLYAEDLSWDSTDKCFIWHFIKQKGIE